MSSPNGTTAAPERGTESVEALVGREVVPEPTGAAAWTRDAAIAAKAAPLRIYLGAERAPAPSAELVTTR